MHIQIDKTSLNTAVQITQKAAASKTTIPVLAGINIKAEEEKLFFKTTDMEVALSYSIPAEVIEPGTIVLPVRYFSELVKKLPETTITIKKIPTSHIVNISYGESEIMMHGYDPDEFPATPKINPNITFECNISELSSMVKHVVIASSNDEARPLYTGILLQYSDDNFSIVATDTHRLALQSSSLMNQTLQSVQTSGFEVIVPHKYLQDAVRLLEDQEETITITVDESQILLENSATKYYSRLLEGKFPNFRQVIPQKFSSRMRVNTGMLLESVERAALLSREEARIRSNVIKFYLEGNTINITSNAPEIGKLKETIEIYYEGEPIEIQFNANYIIDVLKVIDDEEIVFKFTGPGSASVVQPGENEDYLYLVLPLRT